MNYLHGEIRRLLDEALPASEGFFLSGQDIDNYINKIIRRAELITWFYGGDLRALVAFYANNPASATAFVTMVAVASENRNSSIASSMIQAMFKSLSKRGFEKCTLEVHSNNAAALALYEKLGFRPVSSTESRLILEAKLNREPA